MSIYRATKTLSSRRTVTMDNVHRNIDETITHDNDAREREREREGTRDL